MEDILMPKYDEASIGVSRINEYLKSKEQLQRANVITDIAKITGYRSLKIEGKSRAGVRLFGNQLLITCSGCERFYLKLNYLQIGLRSESLADRTRLFVRRTRNTSS